MILCLQLPAYVLTSTARSTCFVLHLGSKQYTIPVTNHLGVILGFDIKQRHFHKDFVVLVFLGPMIKGPIPLTQKMLKFEKKLKVETVSNFSGTLQYPLDRMHQIAEMPSLSKYFASWGTVRCCLPSSHHALWTGCLAWEWLGYCYFGTVLTISIQVEGAFRQRKATPSRAET